MAQEIKKQETSGAAVPRYWDPFAEMRAEWTGSSTAFSVAGL
jgi:hypothetical protein